MSEIIYDKEKEGYTILNVNDNGFYYSNSRSLYYYDDIRKTDCIIFQKGTTEVRLYNLGYKISDTGDITVNYDYSPHVYDDYYEYDDLTSFLKSEIEKKFMPSLIQKGVEKPRFIEDKGIIVKIDEFGYLLSPKDEQRIDCILIEEVEYQTCNADYKNNEFIFTNRFNLSELPKKFQPTFENNLLNYIFYSDYLADEEEEFKDQENKFKWFEFKIKLCGDGHAEIMDTINSAEDSFLKFDKTLLKDKLAFNKFLEGDTTCNLRRWYYQEYWFYQSERHHQEHEYN